MNESLPPCTEPLSLAVGRRIDKVCNDFECAWKAGLPPRIEDRLSDWDEPERTALVRELIHLDLSYRRRAGDECLTEEYLARFPLLDGDWLVAAFEADDLTLGSGVAKQDFEYESTAPHFDFLAPPQNPGELGRLGPYHVLKVLGVGGMGVVFQAHDPQLERMAALKAMLPVLAAGALARQRFLREAQATAAIKHDHIVTIYQVGEDRGVPFLAMEFLEGEALSARLKREGRLPVGEVLRIGREIAEGLDAAHQRGLIHRDIKPANIWLEGEHRRVKLLDFGLARSVGDNSQLTRQGAMVGTPAYMSPEQAAGRPADARGDLFSLGCVLYRMAVGVLPFQGADAISMLVAVSTESPTLPLHLNQDVPAPVSALIMRLLSKKADDRPASARAVVDAIQDIEKRLATFQVGVENGAAFGFDATVRPEDDENPTGLTPARVVPSRRGRLVWLAVAVFVMLGLAAYWYGPAVMPFASDKEKTVGKVDDAGIQSLGADAAEKALRCLLAQEANPNGNLDQLRFEVAEFRRKHAGTPQALEAARLLEWTPSPLDALNREAISPYELAVAGGGDPGAAPKELTAVLGDSRLRHLRWARDVFFSDDGKKLVSGGGGEVKVWDTASGEALQTIGCDKNSHFPALASDGRTLAVGGEASEVQLWALGTGKAGRTLRGHTGQIYAVAFSHDGKTLASAGADGAVKLWDRAAGEVRRTLNSRQGAPWLFFFSADDKTLTLVFDDRATLTWDLAGGGEPSETKTGQVSLPSPDGSLTAVINEQDNTVKVVNATTGKERHILSDLNFPARSAAFSADGRRLATGGYGGELKIWNLDTGKILQNLACSTECSVLGVAFSADGRLLASAGDDRRVRLWDVGTGKEQIPLKPGYGCRAAVGPDGRSLVTLDFKTVKILDLTTGRESQRPPKTDPMWRFALCPDGRSLLQTMPWSGAISQWSFATAQAQPVGVHAGWPTALVVSPDGALAASSVDGPEVKLWDLAALREVRTFTHVGPVASLAFSPDGRTLAAATSDKVVKVWSTADGREQRTLMGSCVAFSPEGPLAAAAGDTVTLYDPASWRELRRFHRTAGEPLEPLSLVFNPSGRLVAASNLDGKIDVWNLNDAKAAPRSFWASRSRQVDTELAFTPEGRYLISANANGTVYVLRLAPAPEK